MASQLNHQISLDEAWKHSPDQYPLQIQPETITSISNPVINEIRKFWNEIKHTFQYPAIQWATQLDPWNELVESSRQIWGKRFINYYIADLAAGIKSIKEKGGNGGDYWDEQIPLCLRARYARMRSGSPEWWKDQFKRLKGKENTDVMGLLLICCTWCKPRTIVEIASQLNELLDNLPTTDWLTFFDVLDDAIPEAKSQLFSPLYLDLIPLTSNERLLSFISLRIKKENYSQFYQRFLNEYKGGELELLKICQEVAIQKVISGEHSWQSFLENIKKSYKNMLGFYVNPRTSDSFQSLMPPEIAKEILINCDDYPGELVKVAERKWHAETSSKVIPVAEVARQESW